jgi:hypothetical protein
MHAKPKFRGAIANRAQDDILPHGSWTYWTTFHSMISDRSAKQLSQTHS